jgi:hypothetical protein
MKNRHEAGKVKRGKGRKQKRGKPPSPRLRSPGENRGKRHVWVIRQFKDP